MGATDGNQSALTGNGHYLSCATMSSHRGDATTLSRSAILDDILLAVHFDCSEAIRTAESSRLRWTDTKVG